MKYILSFINVGDDTEHLDDGIFDSLADLERYINEEFPDFTSYGITVVKSEVQP